MMRPGEPPTVESSESYLAALEAIIYKLNRAE